MLWQHTFPVPREGFQYTTFGLGVVCRIPRCHALKHPKKFFVIGHETQHYSVTAETSTPMLKLTPLKVGTAGSRHAICTRLRSIPYMCVVPALIRLIPWIVPSLHTTRCLSMIDVDLPHVVRPAAIARNTLYMKTLYPQECRIRNSSTVLLLNYLTT